MRTKSMKRFLSLACALLLALGMGTTALAADSAVTYEGQAEKFIFSPGSDQSPTDLFDGFKDVMPGDALTEQIEIRNSADNGVKVRVYMRSLGAQENTDAFLSQMTLTVKQDGDSNLFAAPADETAQLTDWVYLGTVYSGGEITLDVTLDVPLTMGDEFQNAAGYIDWQFRVEELPVEESDPKPPQTGDSSNAALYIALAAASGCGIVLLAVYTRRRKREDA